MSSPKELSELRYHVFVCADGGSFCGCDANGGAALVGDLRRQLIKRRLMPYVKVTLMNCNQPGAQGPVVVVYPDGHWYDGLRPDELDAFCEAQLLAGEPYTPKLMSAPVRTGSYGL